MKWLKEKLQKAKKWIAGFFISATALTGGALGADSVINPYDVKADKFEIVKSSQIEAGGRVETVLSRDEQKITLSKWDGRANLGITYKGIATSTKGERDFLSSKVKYKDSKSKQELHAYPLSDTSLGEDGALEIEVVFSEKPATNTFDFQLDGWENLEFCYQPRIDSGAIAEENSFKEGVPADWCDIGWVNRFYNENDRKDGYTATDSPDSSRPENVINSYAVYHKTLANHILGQTNFATGKAYHIYRLKFIDGKGKEFWADMNYLGEGLLRAEIPLEVFDDKNIEWVGAVLDPTFGYLTCGASGKAFDTNHYRGISITTNKGISINSIHACTNENDNTRVSLFKGVISNSSSIISNGVSDIGRIVDNVVKYNPALFTLTPNLLSNSSYDIGVVSSEGFVSTLFYDSVSGGFYHTTNSFTSPVVPVKTDATEKYSIYLHYQGEGTFLGLGTQPSDIGSCYQSGTAVCFTGVSNPNANARLGYRSGVNFGNITSGFRFPNITIPKGSTITSAVFRYTAYETDSTSPPTVAVFAEDVDNSPTFTTTGADSPDTVEFGGSRATTTAFVSWTLVNQTVDNLYDSPDISSVIQEVVNRDGWQSGNALSIITAPIDYVDNFNARNATSSAFLIITYKHGFNPLDFSYCRTMTALAGGNVGGMATTTSLPFQLVATSTISTLAATSSGGNVQLLTWQSATSTTGTTTIPTDIVFSDGDTCYPGGTDTAIPHSFEYYASTTGAFAVDLLVTGISSTTNQVITMYYGNASATDLNSPPQVWATTTSLLPLGHWGLSENVKGPPPQSLDSTYNYLHGSSILFWSATSTVSGMIGNGLQFDPRAIVGMGDTAVVDGVPKLSVLAWVKASQANTGNMTVSAKRDSAVTSAGWALYRSGTAEKYRFAVGTGSLAEAETDAAFQDTNWHFVAGVYDGANVNLYIDGVTNKDSTPPAQTGNVSDVSSNLCVGGRSGSGVCNVSDWVGTLDNIFIGKEALHTMDILTIYNNTKSSTIFWTFGGEQTPPAGGTTVSPMHVLIKGIMKVIGQLIVK